MKLDFEEYVIDVAEEVSEGLGNTLDVSSTRCITRPSTCDLPRDATFSYYVDGKRRGDDIVLLISNPFFPDAVRANASRAYEATAMVGEDVGRHIEKPVLEGLYGRQTYAAYHRLCPISKYRFVRVLQKPKVSRNVVAWLTEVAKDSGKRCDRTVEYTRYFRDPLDAIVADTGASDMIRNRASRHREFIAERKPDLFTSIQHGDLWIGNVLFEKGGVIGPKLRLDEFRIIDWAGSWLDGYPCIDLVRYILSIYRKTSNVPRMLVNRYKQSVGISETEFSIYCVLSLGRLGQNLDQFPRERYHALCERVVDFLELHATSALKS